jgi:hypothetical protein
MRPILPGGWLAIGQRSTLTVCRQFGQVSDPVTDVFMRIGLLSDTHGFLDDALITNFRECDEIWHAGDFGASEVLDQLNRLKPVRGVFGNVDGPEIRSRLPEDLEWCSENVRVYMTHICV